MRVALVGLLAILLAGCGAAPDSSPSPTMAEAGATTPPASEAASPSALSPAATGEPSPTDTPRASGSLGRPALTVGDSAIVVTDDLRVRSKPSVSEDSIKYSPLLALGTYVDVREGPVFGSGYWWYRVDPELPCPPPADIHCGFAFANGARDGWVAAADHDGTPWLLSPSHCPTADTETGWPNVSRCGVTMTGGTPLSPGDSSDDLVIPVRLSGLTPGSTVTIAATADRSVTWVCGVAPSPCGQLGCGPAEWDATEGSATLSRQLTVGSAGSVTTNVVLHPGVPPAPRCPADPWGVLTIGWTSIWIADPADGLILTPPRQSWGVTF